MSSEVISFRAKRELKHALSKFAFKHNMFTSDVVISALQKMIQENSEVPEYLRGLVAVEMADRKLKLEMSRMLFLHNVRQKIRKLVTMERIEKTLLKDIIQRLMVSYIDNAKAKGWLDEAQILEEMLNNATSKDINLTMEFARWSGLSKRFGLGELE